MHAYQANVLGLLFDIVGAFFLAAEAIKIDNLRRLRAKVLARLRHATVSPPFALGEGEELTPEREQQFREAFEFGAPWGAKHPQLFTLLHYLAGTLICLVVGALAGRYVADWLSILTDWLLKTIPAFAAYTVIALATLFFVVAGLWILGELVHMTIVGAIRRSIDVIEYVEQHAADGTVGIIGFCLIFVGFLLQLIGAIVAAT